VAVEAPPSRAKQQIGWILAAMIVLAFVAIMVAKSGSSGAAGTSETPGTSATSSAGSSVQAPAATDGPSQSHADPAAAYDAALASGKPIFVLFHSLTCDPCIEISAVVDKVIADYEGEVVFVNAITTDDAAMRLAARFRFQYIPQSFFIDSKGEIVDSFTGAMDETAMRGYLDKLAAR